MSLVQFSARNHQQQVAVSGARPEVDDRQTTSEVFDPIAARFGGFTVDVAALPHNTKCKRYYTPLEDGLAQSWEGERVWCNPPYSSIEPWIVKAWAEDVELVVMLVPANRTEQGWWQRHVEPHRDRGHRFRVEFLPGRLRFIAHDDDKIRPNQRPPFGCALLIWGPR